MIALSVVFTELSASAGVITADTVWQGEVTVSEDILIPEGVTLTILPGAVLKMVSTDSTKTDPEYLSPLTEITVRGTLKAEGAETRPISFGAAEGDKPEGWAGIIVDGGSVVLRSCSVQDAETGLYVLKGSGYLFNTLLQKNRYGLVAQGREAGVRLVDSRVRDNEYGIFLINGATIDKQNTTVLENRKKDFYSISQKDAAPAADGDHGHLAEKRDPSRIYGDAVLRGDTVWQGAVEVNGIIRVPEESRLLIMPGTVVAFKKRDTNNDGIGENGLLIQGVLIAKGMPEQPIIFRSAERRRAMGDWDAINIMNSDAAQNLIEYCRIEDAYRGLHFHFSNVAVHASMIRNNYRGVQFQESTVEMTRNRVYDNKSGIQGRDSEVVFTDNAVYHNYTGVNFFRANLTATRNAIVNNHREGLRIREGIPVVEENTFDGNRYGFMVADAWYGSFRRNVIIRNIESGLLLKGTDNIEVAGNIIQGNGFNGLNIQDASAVIKGNIISDNGERGIGVLSFSGIITENNIVHNGVYAMGLESDSDISAPSNWWGTTDVQRVIHDKNNDSGKGTVHYLPVKNAPVLVSWPLPEIASDITWYGGIQVTDSVTVLSGHTLTLAPPVAVFFSRDAELRINGRIAALGDKQGSITFTSLLKTGPADWGEIFLDHADGSVFSNCDFEYATWGIHCHFTHLRVEGCRFRKNYGGIRFRGGPMEVLRSLFEGNEIGLRAYRGTALIAENTFTGNDVGIFVREKGGGLTITKNNLYANSGYNVRIGDFNDEDVTARENYWGQGDPAETILDGRKEQGIGMVHYEPFHKEPYALEDRKGPR